MAFGRRFNIPTNSFLHRFLLRRSGRRDGRAGIPQPDEATLSEQEKQLVDRGQQHLAQLAANYARAIRRLEATLTSEIERFRLLLTAFKDETHRYNRRRTELNRNVVEIHVSQFWYRLLISLIVVGEFALNAQAFEVFQKPLLLTWLMAMMLGVGIPAAAHATGLWLRQWPKPAWITGVKLAGLVGGSVACLMGINVARQAYLDQQHLTSGPQADLLEHAFLAINIFVFITAAVLSHFSHDPDYELETLHRRVSNLDRKLDASDRKIYRSEGDLAGMRVKQQAEIDEIRAMIRELISIYREANRLARGGERVQAFEQTPEIDPPAYVAVLSEELRHQAQELRRVRYEARGGTIVTSGAAT